MYILGINAFHPDASACLTRDGVLLAAVEEERLSRIKHHVGFPAASIRYCLSVAGISLFDVDYIAVSRNPFANPLPKFVCFVRNLNNRQFLYSRLRAMGHVQGLRHLFMQEFASEARYVRARVCTIEHHQAHLASGFFVSPFQDAAIVSLDGFGDCVSGMVAHGKGNTMRIIDRVTYPHSMGLMYTAVSQFLGFREFGDESKVMSLAAYGKPVFAAQLRKMLLLKPKGRYALDLKFFKLCDYDIASMCREGKPFVPVFYSELFIKEFGLARGASEPITQFHCDLASSLQQVYEETLFHVLSHAHRACRTDHLCLVGGCAQNSVANGLITQATAFKHIFIQPAASDAGGALGAAYYVYCQMLGRQRSFVMSNAYWGPQFNNHEIEEMLVKNKIVFKKFECDTLLDFVAKRLAHGAIVGWFQGRSEWGPRS
ncbi:MAG: carbamoyltransferase, partial [Candidatus Omnitrophica bacterium]|nr:carbamoyltransferase [Candidatus Omnitrophota bacterium]